MKALLSTLVLTCALLGQAPAPPPPPTPPQVVEQEPPEEDLSPAEKKVYVLNPLQAAKELRIGNYYFKKGSFKAAAGRFDEATRWDPSLSEAFLRLGDAKTKLGDKKAAQEAWKKYLELEPAGKEAGAIRKKLGKS